MAANTGKLAGMTLFITGASRGIGKAIAMKAAKDGANIIIAAKTAQAHPKLAGTIYTAAQELEAAGGKCLPCIVDVRDEAQVHEAVSQAVGKFGGIDILVNNASAISLTGTEDTAMKKYDLMNGVNARGTYLCSQACLPHLKVGKNPHILNISPPLNMNKKWFQNHVAYTMAKYGMSMCALGMAEEFRPLGIAVNALWPRTAIYTAAMEMLAGDTVADQCRTSDIMADAAYVVLSKDSKSYTGNFAIDDEVLQGAGVTDLSGYSCVPGGKLMLDFFLDGGEGFQEEAKKAIKSAATAPPPPAQAAAAGGEVSQTFQKVEPLLNEELVKSIGGVFLFDLKGAEEGKWFMDLKNGAGSLGQGDPPTEPNCTMVLKSEDFGKLFRGELKAASAFMTGKLKIKGDMGLAMKLDKLMSKVKSKL